MLQQSRYLPLLTLLLFFATSIIHIALGICLLGQNAVPQSIIFNNNYGLGVFLAVAGGYMAMSSGWEVARERRRREEVEWSRWLVVSSWLVVAIAAAIVQGRHYSKYTTYYNTTNTSAPSTSTLPLCLATTIITFLLALPSSIYQIYRTTTVYLHQSTVNYAKILPEDKYSESDFQEQVQPQLSVTISKHLTRDMGFEGSRQIDKTIQELNMDKKSQ